MCYPCSHCGACRVKLDPGKCPNCHAAIEENTTVCPTCGFKMPLPPGQMSAPSRAAERSHVAAEEDSGASAGEDTLVRQSKLDKGSSSAKRHKRESEYVPPDMDDGHDAPRAEEFGVVGSWPVPSSRPKL